MRKEAALLVGASGAVLVLFVQIATGTADVSAVGPALSTVGTTALPLILAGVTRAAVWSQKSVESLLERQSPVVADLVTRYGAPAVVEGLSKSVDFAQSKVDTELGS